MVLRNTSRLIRDRFPLGLRRGDRRIRRFLVLVCRPNPMPFHVARRHGFEVPIAADRPRRAMCRLAGPRHQPFSIPIMVNAGHGAKCLAVPSSKSVRLNSISFSRYISSSVDTPCWWTHEPRQYLGSPTRAARFSPVMEFEAISSAPSTTKYPVRPGARQRPSRRGIMMPSIAALSAGSSLAMRGARPSPPAPSSR